MLTMGARRERYLKGGSHDYKPSTLPLSYPAIPTNVSFTDGHLVSPFSYR